MTVLALVLAVLCVPTVAGMTAWGLAGGDGTPESPLHGVLAVLVGGGSVYNAVVCWLALFGDRASWQWWLMWAAPVTGIVGLLVASDDGESAYLLRLEPVRGRLVLDRWPRGRTGDEQWHIHGDVPHAVELERPVALAPGRHTLQVQLDDDILVAVVDDAVTLSTRVYDLDEGRVGVFATDGGFDLTRLDVATRGD